MQDSDQSFIGRILVMTVNKTSRMKNILKNIIGIALFLFALVFCLPGCYETHYYHEYHHHTKPWYERHHRQPPADINFEIDIYKRGH